MKLLDILLLTGSLAFFVIGIYEAMVLGIGQAYGIFMISLGLLFVLKYRKKRVETNDKDK